MKRALLVVAVLLALGLIVLGSVRAGSGSKGTKVYAEPAARREIAQIVKASGSINPRVKVNISAHVVAKIEKLYVSEGDWIEKGKPFLTLEKAAFVALRDSLAAQLRSNQTEVEQARVSLADSTIKLKRAVRLQAEGVVSTEQLEAAVLAERSARLHLSEAEQMVGQTRASLVKADDDLTKTTLYAPLSGRVIALAAKEGEVVVPGTMNNSASVIGTIADLSEVLAEVDVDETEIVNIRPGQTGILKVDALPHKLYHGKVTEVGSSSYGRAQQPDVTFFKVKLLLDDADQQLRPGMSVRSEIRTETRPNALGVPVQSVVDRAVTKPAAAGGEAADAKTGVAAGDESKVVFVVAAGKVHQRVVETGITDETHVEILAGLRPGEVVVTGPYRSLRDLKEGQLVEIGKPVDDQAGTAADGGGKNGKDKPAQGDR
ncbi:MAG: efflux RND transporter periplasmic adaptor subunit [Acidobacteriota bacterium]|nr:efflux RND transporter periplasmic adaptor subunit [Acidobacteriota bacterium]